MSVTTVGPAAVEEFAPPAYITDVVFTAPAYDFFCFSVSVLGDLNEDE